MVVNKVFVFTLFIFLLITACSRVRTDAGRSSEKKAVVDTLESSSQDFEEPDFSETLQQFIELYGAPIYIDSTIKIGPDTLQFRLKHFSLLDSIVVPKKYNWGVDKFDYGVRNFASQIRILMNNDVLVDTTVRKDEFIKLLDSNLKDYGVLLYPSYQAFDSSDQAFIVNYSVSIPCTDLGKSVTLKIRLDSALEAY
jgi:hypothetical protein